MDTPFIPRKTIEELSAGHPEGTRHQAIIKIAMSLLGNNLPATAVFATIRPQFDAEKTDKEIWDVIEWCATRNPTPSVPMNGNGAHRSLPGASFQRPAPNPKLSKDQIEKSALGLATDFIDETPSTPEKTIERSKIPIGDFQTNAQTLLNALYTPDDRLNLVCRYTVNEKGKANPLGGGKTLSRDEWLVSFRKDGVPGSSAGAWIRPNPCGKGSGKDGSIRDEDILRHDFALLESDHLPVGVQLALYEKWQLPIAAILTSGGDSVHAWVRVGASSISEYESRVGRLMELVKPFGFDQSNRNPSRLSRLVGAKRTIGATGDGLQRLLYLAPESGHLTDETLADFEKQIAPPFLTGFPMRRIARDSISRYEELHAMQGATGLRTGLATFDRKTGGLKRGNMILLAAHTNTGKSSLVLNIISQALRDGKTVALFTLEMDRDEIYDLMVSMNFTVDRNVFNTGRFLESDLIKITNATGKIAKWPMHIFDDPTMTCDQIEERCLKLLEIGGLDLVVVDYLQLVSIPFMARESREQQVAQIGRSLRTIAKKCKVPLIAVSQLNEEGKIRESRAVAHDAHIVFILEWDDGSLKLRITKGRSVPKEDYEMYFDATHCKMSEAAKISSAQVEMRKDLQ